MKRYLYEQQPINKLKGLVKDSSSVVVQKLVWQITASVKEVLKYATAGVIKLVKCA